MYLAEKREPLQIEHPAPFWILFDRTEQECTTIIAIHAQNHSPD